ncbi:MAG: metal-dependent hydrolase [Microthrixaceae bacterium]|nr:metal-dependent hydrolase [Microthrixaceae bacterium]
MAVTQTATKARNGHRPSADREIPVRRLEVTPDASGTDWIVPGDPIFSHLLAVLSAVFPRGEDFFVASVRRHRDAIAEDPKLKAQVKGFIGQEAMHGREHRALNAQLAELGYATVRADRIIGEICDFILKLPPETLAIAVTAAAEHFTGLLGEAALGDESTRNTLFGQEAIEPLICWHALEELEHKNVAFDVMVAAGAGYPVRAAGFAVTTGVLAGYIVFEWGRCLVGDRRQIKLGHVRKFVSDLRRQKLLSGWSLGKAVSYLRPGFHPDDTDTDALVAEWRERLAEIAPINTDRKSA